MPRDLFGTVTRPFTGAGARSRYTVPLSFAAHTLAVVTVVVVPLLASDALPALRGRVVYSAVMTLVPPEPPRPPIIRHPRVDAQMANANAAPVVAPVGITPEPEWKKGDPMTVPGTENPVDGGIRNGLFVLEPPPPPPPPPAPSKPIRIGNGISPPTKVHDAVPVYPAIAQAARVQGVVIIQATIGVDGAVIDATVLRSMPLLDAAALDAVRQWRYAPTRLNGEPVAVVMTVTVNFQLR